MKLNELIAKYRQVALAFEEVKRFEFAEFEDLGTLDRNGAYPLMWMIPPNLVAPDPRKNKDDYIITFYIYKLYSRNEERETGRTLDIVWAEILTIGRQYLTELYDRFPDIITANTDPTVTKTLGQHEGTDDVVGVKFDMRLTVFDDCEVGIFNY